MEKKVLPGEIGIIGVAITLSKEAAVKVRIFAEPNVALAEVFSKPYSPAKVESENSFLPKAL